MPILTKEKKPTTGEQPVYRNGVDHLLDELRWLNRILTAQVLSLRQVNFYEKLKDFRDLFIADEEIDALLAAGVFEDNGKYDDDNRSNQIAGLYSQAQEMWQIISEREQQAIERDLLLPLFQLERLFQLDEFELKTLIICLAPQIDNRYEKIYAYLQNDLTKKLPSVNLVLQLLCQSYEERIGCLGYFHSSATLRNFHLLELVNDNSHFSLGSQSIQIDPQMIYYLAGTHAIGPVLLSLTTLLRPAQWEDVVIKQDLRVLVQKLFYGKGLIKQANEDSAPRPILYLYGRAGVGKKTIARALCGEAGITLAVADMRQLLNNPENFQNNIRLILRDCLLHPCALCFDHLEKLIELDEENPGLLKSFTDEIFKLSWITFLCSEKPLPNRFLEYPMIYPIEILAPDHQCQKRLWESQLHKKLTGAELLQVDQLANFFDLTGAQIEQAVHLAEKNALARDPDNGQLTITDLFTSSRIQSQPKLSTLARKIAPKYHWNDIVLPQNQLQQLRELANQVKYKQVVMDDWGFANKLSLGHGLNALFSGPSGTGKTMAAEVIANELGLDLYKIDLSAVVSKYIGETEKNLNKVFTEAEHSNCILFFDEADALLGKRSEVKDAHDRYANIEIAYLLQKMEEYKGVTILATNSRRNIDDAFTRRIRFIIEFPLPEEEYRFGIWQKIFPIVTPIENNIDFQFLAKKFKISGGNIKNIALAAAFYAASDGHLVTMHHLIQATKQELQKIGKLYIKADFEEYDYLVK